MHTFNKIEPRLQADIFYLFSNQENGYKIKKNTPIVCNGKHYILPNSVIKIDNELYQVATGPNKLIGKGQFGRVKYAQHILSSKSYALKVESFNPFADKKTQKNIDITINRENFINLDVNLSIANTKLSQYAYKKKNYSVLYYKGNDLTKLLENP